MYNRLRNLLEKRLPKGALMPRWFAGWDTVFVSLLVGIFICWAIGLLSISVMLGACVLCTIMLYVRTMRRNSI
jgi:hypothetical protein